MDLLPAEMLCQIFSFLDDYSLVVRLVAREWYALSGVIWSGNFYIKPLVDFSFSKGHSRLLFWLLAFLISPRQKKNLHYSQELFSSLAARQGNLLLLKWSKENGFPWSTDQIFEEALRHNQINLLEWMKKEGAQPQKKERIIGAAVLSGQASTVLWLKEELPDSFSSLDTIHQAALHGQTKILEHFYTSNYPHQVELFNSAISSGSLESVAFLRKKGCSWGSTAWTEAGKKNDLKMLQWLWKQNCPLPRSYKTIQEAAGAGNLEATKWFLNHDQVSPYFTANDSLLETAARSGNLELVEYLVEQGLTPNSETLSQAVLSGNVDLAEFILGRGASWQTPTSDIFLFPKECFYFTMVEKGYLTMVQWLLSRELTIDLNALALSAGQEKKPRFFQAFSAYLPLSSNCLRRAVVSGGLETIKWLVENGCPMERELLPKAAERGRLEIFLYLFEKGCSYDKKQCLNSCRKKNKTILKWLSEH